MNVNYVRESTLFMENAGEWGLSVNARTVWHALFHIFNARRWPDGPVPIDNNRLILYAGISVNAMMSARNQLVECGLLKYTKGQRNTATPTYELVMPSVMLGLADDDKIGVNTQCYTQGYTQSYTQCCPTTSDIRININKDINENQNVIIVSQSQEAAGAREDDKDDDDDTVGKAFRDGFGTELTASERGMIRGVMQEHNLGADVLTAAVGAAREHQAKKPVMYVLRVLRDWAANGGKMAEAVRYGGAPKQPRRVIEQCYEQRDYSEYDTPRIDPWLAEMLAQEAAAGGGYETAWP